jgi:hypothetical protein
MNTDIEERLQRTLAERADRIVPGLVEADDIFRRGRRARYRRRALTALGTATAVVALVAVAATATFGGGQRGPEYGSGRADNPWNAPSATQTVDVVAAGSVSTVPSISGTVTDAYAGKPIAGAKVTIQDSVSHAYITLSNKDGKWSFTSTDQAPIAPGVTSYQVEKDKYEKSLGTLRTIAGVASANVNVAMSGLGGIDPSATASGPTQRPAQLRR